MTKVKESLSVNASCGNDGDGNVPNIFRHSSVTIMVHEMHICTEKQLR